MPTGDIPAESSALGSGVGKVIADDVVIALPDVECLGETGARVERIVYKYCACTCFCACDASASVAAASVVAAMVADVIVLAE